MSRISFVMRAGRALAAAALISLAVALLAGCGSSSSDSTNASNASASQAFTPSAEEPMLKAFDPETFKSDKVVVEQAEWQAPVPPEGDRIRIISESGFCKGEPAPQYKGVRVLERGERVYITTYIDRPTPKKGVKCLGIGSLQRGIVELHQDAREARLYDGASSPPTLRWPK